MTILEIVKSLKLNDYIAIGCGLIITGYAIYYYINKKKGKK